MAWLVGSHVRPAPGWLLSEAYRHWPDGGCCWILWGISEPSLLASGLNHRTATPHFSTLRAAGRATIVQSGRSPPGLQRSTRRRAKGCCWRPARQMLCPALRGAGSLLRVIVPVVPLTSPLWLVQPAAFRRASLPHTPPMTLAFLSPKCWTEGRHLRCPALLTASSSRPGWF